jgi:thiosulfate dehydrogenase [quinone] large subunit
MFTRLALSGGALLMLVLTFGTTLRQDWNTAGLQLIYAVVYAALLACLSANRYSIDRLLQPGKSTLSPAKDFGEEMSDPVKEPA